MSVERLYSPRWLDAYRDGQLFVARDMAEELGRIGLTLGRFHRGCCDSSTSELKGCEAGKVGRFQMDRDVERVLTFMQENISALLNCAALHMLWHNWQICFGYDINENQTIRTTLFSRSHFLGWTTILSRRFSVSRLVLHRNH